MKPLKSLLVCLLCLKSLVAAGDSASVADLLKKKDIKVLVTDSGLGGLSVCGDLEKKILARRSFRSVEVVFCNALPESNYGYNDITNEQQKAAVFTSALKGMVKNYHPDIILIACNTLSVVYPATEFSRTAKTPVVGIVDLGVDILCKRMLEDPAATAVIFGTETTIAANSHKSQCVARGIDASRIIAQPCSGLAAEIQGDAQGEAAKNLIDAYVGEAADRLPAGGGKVLAALCCTHFGYCRTMFLNAFADAGKKDAEIVNPNDKMADLLFAPASDNRFSAPAVTVKVVSQALVSPEEIRSIAALLQKESPKTAEALRKYERKSDLFPYRRG